MFTDLTRVVCGEYDMFPREQEEMMRWGWLARAEHVLATVQRVYRLHKHSINVCNS